MSKTESTNESGNHLEMFFYRAPKRNHDALVQNLKRFDSWMAGHGVKVRYYRLGSSTMQGCEGMAMEDMAKALSAGDDEDIWVEMQHFSDRKHCEETFAVMMKDKELESLGKEFFSLITPGKSMVTGGYDLAHSV